jgi:hypothetical protein
MRHLAWCSLLLLVSQLGCAAHLSSRADAGHAGPSLSGVELNEGGLTLLPISVGRGLDGYRDPLWDSLTANLSENVPGFRTLQRQIAADSLTSEDTFPAFRQLADRYARSFIVDRESVRRLGSAISVRYALYCVVGEFCRFKSRVRCDKPRGGQTALTARALVIDLRTGDVELDIASSAGSSGPWAEEIAGAIVRRLPRVDSDMK